MTDRQPAAPGDEPTPEIEPEATEGAAVPDTDTPDIKEAGDEEVADDEMAEDPEIASAPDPDAEPGAEADSGGPDGDEADFGEPDEADFADEADIAAEEDALGAEADDEVLEAAATATVARGARLGGRLQRSPAAPATPSERAVHISDRTSQVFVIAATLTFVGIVLYAMVAGVGGFLTPRATPTPSVEESESPSASPSLSISPSTSASGSPSTSGSASPASSASSSPAAPSASPSAS
jgi:hypothetical protein